MATVGRAFWLGMLMAPIVGVAVAAPARADERATREAQTRFEEGLAHAKTGDFESARVSFAQAYSVLHKPEILWNLALCEQKSGHLLEALGHFKQVQMNAKSEQDRASAAKHVSELMPQTAHVEVEAPAGATVVVDGATIGIAPLSSPVDVGAGKHHVEIHTSQGSAKSADTDAVIGEVAHVSFVQAEAAEPVPTESAPTDAQPPSTPPPAEAPLIEPRPSSGGWDARTVTVVILGSVAVASGGIGLAMGIVSNNDASTAFNLRQQNPSCWGSSSPGCMQLSTTTEAQHNAYVASEAFWIAGAALAVGALGVWAFWPRGGPSGTARVQMVPVLGPGEAGAAAIGRF